MNHKLTALLAAGLLSISALSMAAGTTAPAKPETSHKTEVKKTVAAAQATTAPKMEKKATAKQNHPQKTAPAGQKAAEPKIKN